MQWWNRTFREIEKTLKTDSRRGLSGEEAEKRLQEQGRNCLEQGEGKKGFFRRFLAQFNDFMILVLLGAAAVSFGVSYWNGEADFVDSIIIVAIVVLNALLGVLQESRAEKALEALKELSAPKARVLRDGKEKEIPAEEVVTGDILLLSAGEYICADGRLTEVNGMKTEESAITGESLSVEKETGILAADTVPGDRRNMVLSGSYVLTGRGKAIVTARGMDTELGRIASLLAEQEEMETPLQKKLGETGKLLGIGAMAICAVIFVMGLLQKQEPFTMFMTSVSLAVAAIPEGLPAIVTIVLAIGMQRLSKKNAVIRRLPAVETLGSAQIICSDKTGTLTQNRMKVTQLAVLGRKQPEQDEEKRRFLLTLFTLCNDIRQEGTRIVGEPTEKALAEAAEENGVSIKGIRKELPRVGEVPFSSERKLMTTVHRMENGTFLSVTKGAPDVLLERCTRCLDGAGQAPFDGRRKSEMRMKNGEMAANALRVVAAAFREWDEKPKNTPEVLEQNLVFAGLAGMIDPPRTEAAEAVQLCRQAGIRPVMITGDHALTAQAIAGMLGIYQAGDRVITGQELEQMDDTALEKAVEHCTVFARVAPEHKVRIVKALQSGGYVVAMNGDGVNDAPALRAADIGCAMGKNGTEVAKGAADMVLLDDNFATIVAAVQEGRGIYDNIRKAVHFLLSSNIGEILTIFAAMCFGWAAPLLPIQLLWVNLVTDSLPAIALGLDPAEKDCMERPPRRDSSLFADGLGWRIALEGMMIGMLALLAFGIGHIYFDEEKLYTTGRTMAFAVLSLSQLVHAFNMRSEQSLFRISLKSNPWLIGAFLAGCMLQISVIMIEPLAGLFQVCPLDGKEWLIVAGLAFVPLPVVELEKAKDNLLKKYVLTKKQKHDNI